VVAYIRVSSKAQAQEGLSMEAQEERIRGWCQAQELQLVAVERDAARSGGKLNRPGLQVALDRLESGEADGLIVLKLDRLTRSVSDLGHLLEDYFGPTSQWSLVCVTESIDTNTASGRLTANVLMSVAQWEREIASERTRSVMEYKREKGEFLGGEPPYGFRVVEGDDGVARLEPDDGERQAMKMARGLRTRLDCSLQDIADAFNEDGMPRRNGRPWTRQAISRLLE